MTLLPQSLRFARGLVIIDFLAQSMYRPKPDTSLPTLRHTTATSCPHSYGSDLSPAGGAEHPAAAAATAPSSFATPSTLRHSTPPLSSSESPLLLRPNKPTAEDVQELFASIAQLTRPYKQQRQQGSHMVESMLHWSHVTLFV